MGEQSQLFVATRSRFSRAHAARPLLPLMDAQTRSRIDMDIHKRKIGVRIACSLVTYRCRICIRRNYHCNLQDALARAKLGGFQASQIQSASYHRGDVVLPRWARYHRPCPLGILDLTVPSREPSVRSNLILYLPGRMGYTRGENGKRCDMDAAEGGLRWRELGFDAGNRVAGNRR